NSHPESLKRVSHITGRGFKVYQGDLMNEDSIEKVFRENKIEAVIHFAGLKAVGESVQIPLMYYECNISGTVKLCNVMRKYNVKNLVFSSSATVYGVPERMPISEDSPLKAQSPYGRTK